MEILINILKLAEIGLILALTIMLINNFLNEKLEAESDNKSWVATWSMVLPFVLNWWLIRGSNGNNPIGLFIVNIGLIANILGRYQLGSNWGDQARVYKDHKLVISGLYKYVRHPMYGSLLLVLVGMAVQFQNVFALIMSLVIFLPMIIYRAQIEEKLLIGKFGDKYKNYAINKKRFIPFLI